MRCASLPRFFAFSLLLPALTAQVATLAVNSASITMNPAGDSYSLQGSFTGVSPTGASYVLLAIGNFGATIPLSDFVQQPGANVFVYQDSTGQLPYWVSSLTVDFDGQTFTAQTSGIALAGLPNPFAVEFGTDQTSACGMARVQQTGGGSYQLTPGDPVGMMCELGYGTAPIATPNVIQAGTPAAVTVSVGAFAFTVAEIPQNVALYLADVNAQPIGDPLCAMTLQSGSFACTVTLNEANPGMLPMVVQATAAGQATVSIGFAVQVAGPVTDSDVQQSSDIEAAMSQAWANFTQYGDTAYARIQTLLALRTLFTPPPGLAGQQVGLALDGVSIAVRTGAGLPIVLVLDDLADMLPSATGSSTRSAPRRDTPRVRSKPSGPSGLPSPTCGLPQWDVVQNNRVLVWTPGDLFFPRNFYSYEVQELQSSLCPTFQIDPLPGSAATVASLSQFANYGTIIMDSHGGFDDSQVFLITGEMSQRNRSQLAGDVGISGTACIPQGCFKIVYPNHPNIQALGDTVIYAGFCHSSEGANGGFAQAFAPNGSKSAYYGYFGCSPTGDDVIYGLPLFQSLVNDYSSAYQAYTAASNAALSVGAQSREEPAAKAHPRNVICSPKSCGPPHFEITGDYNLAYLGNPRIATSGLPYVGGAVGVNPHYSINMANTLSLQAQLDGAQSCTLMTYSFSNPATAGHLLSADSSSAQDNFLTANPSAAYTGLQILPFPVVLPSDNITVDFHPDPVTAAIARGCVNVTDTLPNNILHFDFEGQGTVTEVLQNGAGMANATVSWQADWDWPFALGQASLINADFLAALPGTTVTGSTSVSSPASQCSGSPTPGTPNLGIFDLSTVGGLPTPLGPTLPMWVEAWGAGRLCDGTAIGIGQYGNGGPGYPGSDTAAEIFKFTLDLTQFIGLTNSSTIPTPGTFQSSAGDMANYSGFLTISTTKPCDPGLTACSPSVRTVRH